MLDDLFAARRNTLVYGVGLAALAFVGAAAVAGFVGGRRTFVEAPANAGLTVDAARLDLGTVWARKDLVWKLSACRICRDRLPAGNVRSDPQNFCDRPQSPNRRGQNFSPRGQF